MYETISINKKHEVVIDRDYYEELEQKAKELTKIKKQFVSEKKLRDIAYKIATGNCTTKVMTEAQWNKCKTSNYTLEPFENLDDEFVESHVSDIASSIINEFKHTIKDN